MSRTKLINYIKKNYPDIDVKHGRPSDDLIAEVARKEYSERSLGSIGVLETVPYVICPAFNLTNSSDRNSLKKFKQFIDGLTFEPIGNESFSEGNPTIPDEENKPKRYQSLETLRQPKTKKDNQFLFDLIKTIDKVGKSLNPLLCIDEMRILRSDSMLPRQKLHGDNPLIVDAKSDYAKFLKVITLIVALEDNTTLDIMINDDLTTVGIPRGSMILFNSAIGHCGSANTSSNTNTRVHCKLKSQEIIVQNNTVVEYEECKYKCGKYFSDKTKRADHHRNCRLSPNYERRRKIVTKSDGKYRSKLKMEKQLKNSDSSSKEKDVDNVSSKEGFSPTEKKAITALLEDIDSHRLTQSGEIDNPS